MRTIYQPTDFFEPGKGQAPSFLAIGDSWFWYPNNNLIESLARHEKLKDDFRWMQLVGYNGARLEEYVDGRHAPRVAYELERQNRGSYSAFLISGGGNDAVDYKLALFRDCSRATRVDECVDQEALTYLASRMGTTLLALIYQISRAYGSAEATPPIFMHSYDYPVADGRGFKLAWLKVTGPWLFSAMSRCGVPENPQLRHDVCHKLIDALHDEFDRCAQYCRQIMKLKVHLVNCRGCLRDNHSYKNDWANELHPTREGFDKIVDERWIPALRQHLSHAILP